MEQLKYSFIILFVLVAAIVSYYLAAILLLVAIAYLVGKAIVLIQKGYHAIFKS